MINIYKKNVIIFILKSEQKKGLKFIVPSRDRLQPLTKLHSSFWQTQVIWQSCPYDGKVHLVSQFFPVYPASQAKSWIRYYLLFSLHIKKNKYTIWIRYDSHYLHTHLSLALSHLYPTQHIVPPSILQQCFVFTSFIVNGSLV